MTMQGLEFYMESTYDMELQEVVQQKFEMPPHDDHEIYNIPYAKPWKIKTCQNAFEIKKEKKFSRRFERRYGIGALETFKKIVENPENSLADSGRYFGFTREYARYVYKKVYGCSYAELHRNKQIARARKRSVIRRKKTKKMAYIMKINEKMKSMGMDSLIIDGPPFMILTKGYKLAVKVSSKPVMLGRKMYHLFRNGRSVNTEVDFVVCLCRNEEEDNHFIIPPKAMPKSGVSILHQVESGQSKYAQYREAWHQLYPDQEKTN
jgi:hypothetical protein